MYYKLKNCAIGFSWFALAFTLILFIIIYSFNAALINFGIYSVICGLIYYVIGFLCLLISSINNCKNIEEFSLSNLNFFLLGFIVSSLMVYFAPFNEVRIFFNVLMGFGTIIYAIAFISFFVRTFSK